MIHFYYKIKIKKSVVLVLFQLLLVVSTSAQVSTNNWYVGNTEADEWIKYKRVWLSAGNYRFTMQGVASKEDQKVHLEINGQSLGSITIPINNSHSFEYVHIGHKKFSEGYYDLKLVFETGNVNCDMIFIRKDNSASNSYTSNDISYSINRTDGMHIAPIGAPDFSSGVLVNVGQRQLDGTFKDKNGKLFSQEQIFAWNKQQIYAYTPSFTDQAMDIWVSELVAAKVDFVFMHGRGQNDFINEIDDRDYVGANGNFDPRYIDKFVAAVNRSPYAKGNIKLAYFQDNVSYANVYKTKTGLDAKWGDVAFQEFLWNYAFKPWFSAVPKDMLYEHTPGRVSVQLWTANLRDYNYTTQGNQILECLQYIKQKMISEFNIDPYFVLDKSFFDRDPRTKDLAEGIQSWFSWSSGITSIATHKERKFAFAINGKRFPLTETWLNDWKLDTNIGTPVKPGQGDYHVSSLANDGTEAIRPIFNQGRSENAEWLVLESWSDWREGSTFYRSEHPEYLWPNQYISLVREYADRNSESIVLEAEDCDEFFDKSTGNSGGAYRVHWYQGTDVDLDIYRPLHKLVNISSVGKLSTTLINFSVGFQDFWGFNTNGDIYCHEVDGIPVNWKSIFKPLLVKDLSVGRYYAWAITKDNKVMKTELPYGWSAPNPSDWVDVTSSKSMKDIDLNLKEVWGINTDGEVFYRDLDGNNNWTLVNGKLASISVDDNFVWGFNLSGDLVRISTYSKTNWKTISNPYKLTKIEAGGGEVWGVNAKQEVYRMDVSGDGIWEYVAMGVNVGVGFEFAWILDTSGNFQKYKLEGFDSKSSFSNPNGLSVNDFHFIEKVGVSLFPNPSTSTINIKITGYTGSNVVLNLYDVSGKKMTDSLSFIYHEGDVCQFQIGNKLASGLYIVEVTGINLKKDVKLLVK